MRALTWWYRVTEQCEIESPRSATYTAIRVRCRFFFLLITAAFVHRMFMPRVRRSCFNQEIADLIHGLTLLLHLLGDSHNKCFHDVNKCVQHLRLLRLALYIEHAVVGEYNSHAVQLERIPMQQQQFLEQSAGDDKNNLFKIVVCREGSNFRVTR